ncbi:hypothetical protein [Novacetimonas hansenii]|uniref:Helix-turn-helix domain-containing protein n=1 Tax=Novacetimonas hansenii TaxID=436 RepID=A0ABQ0SH49_NOVHA|nr:hypothetical protein [Novacetimonas hansenii]GAN84031.1 hypothetical protein Gaha_0122_031 [Novacetimonas hansenii JCM 7643]GBQ55820.1 hypothetical protein AA0243_1019 [Novacetimonas hansenii NRIC 0243]GEC64611.1 hypothetical protein GHA01_24600 [Novacetimonas hansenii]
MNFNDIKATIMDCRKARALTALHKDILFQLLFLTRKAGHRSPSHKLIAKMAGASARTVWTALQIAQELGILTIIPRRKRVGRRWWKDTNAYVFRALAKVPEAAASIRKFYVTGNKDIIKKALGAVDNYPDPKKHNHLSTDDYLRLVADWRSRQAGIKIA